MNYSSKSVRWRCHGFVFGALTPSKANRQPTSRCLGQRPYDPATTTFGPYQWQDYQTVQRRRKNLGIGIVELHKQKGNTEEKYGVGLWCQNRPEWQITGEGCESQLVKVSADLWIRSGMYVTIALHGFSVRYSWAFLYRIYHQPRFVSLCRHITSPYPDAT